MPESMGGSHVATAIVHAASKRPAPAGPSTPRYSTRGAHEFEGDTGPDFVSAGPFRRGDRPPTAGRKIGAGGCLANTMPQRHLRVSYNAHSQHFRADSMSQAAQCASWSS